MKISIPLNKRQPEFERLYTDMHDSAYTRAIGMELIHCEQGQVQSQIQLNHHNYSSSNPQTIDPFASIGLIDHSGGSALYTQIDKDAGCSTFDLRIDFISQETTRCLTATTSVISINTDRAVITSHVRNSNNKIIAIGTGLFRIGGFPGVSLNEDSTALTYQPETTNQPLINTLQIIQEGCLTRFDTGNKAAIGWPESQAYHGGAIATLLAQASRQAILNANSQHQLRSIHIVYIRPGKGSETLNAEASIVRLGRAGSTVESYCYHDKSKVVAKSLATFTVPSLSE